MANNNFCYIFFDDALLAKFEAFLNSSHLEFKSEPDPMDGINVHLAAANLSSEVIDAVEDRYNTLMDEQILLAESTEGWVTHQVVGVQLRLPSGQEHTVRLPAELARPLMANFSVDQIQAIFLAVTNAISNPNSDPICQKENDPLRAVF